MRRVNENAFRILANRFRVFTTRMCLETDNATIISLATLMLHNMLPQLSCESYTPEGYINMETGSGYIVEGEWREENAGASVLYKVCQRVIHEKLLSMPNISEMDLLIIFGDLARFPGNGK